MVYMVLQCTIVPVYTVLMYRVLYSTVLYTVK